MLGEKTDAALETKHLVYFYCKQDTDSASTHVAPIPKLLLEKVYRGYADKQHRQRIEAQLDRLLAETGGEIEAVLPLLIEALENGDSRVRQNSTLDVRDPILTGCAACSCLAISGRAPAASGRRERLGLRCCAVEAR